MKSKQNLYMKVGNAPAFIIIQDGGKKEDGFRLNISESLVFKPCPVSGQTVSFLRIDDNDKTIINMKVGDAPYFMFFNFEEQNKKYINPLFIITGTVSLRPCPVSGQTVSFFCVDEGDNCTDAHLIKN